MKSNTRLEVLPLLTSNFIAYRPSEWTKKGPPAPSARSGGRKSLPVPATPTWKSSQIQLPESGETLTRPYLVLVLRKVVEKVQILAPSTSRVSKLPESVTLSV